MYYDDFCIDKLGTATPRATSLVHADSVPVYDQVWTTHNDLSSISFSFDETLLVIPILLLSLLNPKSNPSTRT